MTKNELLVYIDQTIFENNNNEITAINLNSVLKEIIEFANKAEFPKIVTDVISLGNNKSIIKSDDNGLYINSDYNINLSGHNINIGGTNLSIEESNNINIECNKLITNCSGVEIHGNYISLSSTDDDLELNSNGQINLNADSDININGGYLDIYPETKFRENVTFEKNIDIKGNLTFDENSEVNFNDCNIIGINNVSSSSVYSRYFELVTGGRFYAKNGTLEAGYETAENIQITTGSTCVIKLDNGDGLRVGSKFHVDAEGNLEVSQMKINGTIYSGTNLITILNAIINNSTNPGKDLVG